MNPKLLRLSALLVLFSCDSPGEPSDPADLTGVWTYSATGVRFDFATCSFEDIRLTLTQRGDRFSGSTSGGRGACTGSSGTRSLAPTTVEDGIVEGDRVSFSIGDGDAIHTGTREPGEISGTAVYHDPLGKEAVGEFSMTRVRR